MQYAVSRMRGLMNDQSGIAPMLIALIIAAAGLIGVGVITLNRVTDELGKGRAGGERLVALEKRIRIFAFENSRLPCPADGDGEGIERAVCSGADNAGVVPWRTFGLPETEARDPFGRQITYIADPDLIGGDFCNGVSAAPGGLSVSPDGGSSLFALVSHGVNGFGAWLANGEQASIPQASIERDNCASVAGDQTAVQCSDPDTRTVTTGPFDDDINSETLFDDAVLVARSSDYDPICAAAGGSAPRGAQFSFEDIVGTASPGEAGSLADDDLFVGTQDFTRPDRRRTGPFGGIIGRIVDRIGSVGDAFAPVVVVGEGDTPTLIVLGGSDPGETGVACLFLKPQLALRAGRTDMVLRAYTEFSFQLDMDRSGKLGEGLVFAFVPTDTDSGPAGYDDSLPLCGGKDFRLGFESGRMDNFPDSNKFGVEIDTRGSRRRTLGRIADPPNNHLAIDRNSVSHKNSEGPKCRADARGTLSLPPVGCAQRSDAQEDQNWLEAGPERFHQLRVEVHHDGRAKLPSDCGLSDISVQAWVFENGAECTDDCDDLTADYVNVGQSPTAFVKHCLPVPHDQVRIGFTTSFRRDSSEPRLRRFGIGQFQQ